MKTFTAEEMRNIDRRATEEFHIPGIVLMENAGRAVADAAVRILSKRGGTSVILFCGSGNNGGDGLVAARHLANRGYGVDIILMYPPERFRGDALVNYRIAEAMRLPMRSFAANISLGDQSLVIDALLGTGIRGEVTGDLLTAIERINTSSAFVISVDIPSGLDADTGAVLGRCVAADSTVTMAAPKKGLLVPSAADFVGDLVVADIGIPRELIR